MLWLSADIGGFLYGFSLTLSVGALLLALPIYALVKAVDRTYMKQYGSAGAGCMQAVYGLILFATAAVILCATGVIVGSIYAVQAHRIVDAAHQIPAFSILGYPLFLVLAGLIWGCITMPRRRERNQKVVWETQRQLNERRKAEKELHYEEEHPEQVARLPELLGDYRLPGARLVEWLDTGGIEGAVLRMEYRGERIEEFSYFARLLPDGIFSVPPERTDIVHYFFGEAERPGDGRRMTIYLQRPVPLRTNTERPQFLYQISYNCTAHAGESYDVKKWKPIYGGPDRIGMDAPPLQ